MSASTHEDAQPLEVLLDYLKRTRGFDFTGYKRSTLERRIAKRMEAVGVDDYAGYLDHLEVNPDEFAFLFNTILINVTAFLRDTAAWDYLRAETLPHLLEAIPEDDPIRVWCAGCASGEETYTLAMVLADLLGEEAFLRRVKIYATDADEEALNEARLATYAAKQVEAIPVEQRDRYFERVEQRFAFRKDLRRSIIFGRNDLVQDAPISRVDLLLCRNTLMYFNAETQGAILNRFHFALNDHGYLFLGKSEMLITHSALFRPVDLKRRVFTKVPRATLRDRLAFVANGPTAVAPVSNQALQELGFAAGADPHVIVDGDGVLAQANPRARTLLGVRAADVARPLQDLELSYRPLELAPHIEAARRDRREVTVDRVLDQRAAGTTRHFTVHVVPLIAGDEIMGTSIVYEDQTVLRTIEQELETSKRDLEQAYEELQSTVEELETTNEELQSTNEELETTNEELQSTNEELETMNEELQSTNEELQTINDELRERTVELDEVNGYLESILTALGVAVIIVDRKQVIQVWNGQSTELWGMRPEEAEGQHLLGLDIGLPVVELKPLLRDVLAGKAERSEAEFEAVNRRGKPFVCHVAVLPLGQEDGQPSGAIVLMEPRG